MGLVYFVTSSQCFISARPRERDSFLFLQNMPDYYMANPVLGKSLCSDWFFLGQDFAVRTVSMETAQSVYFCFGAKPANST